MAVMRSSRRAQFDSVAAAARHYRGKQPYWRLGQELEVNPENIRALEKKSRPMTALARRVLAALDVDLVRLNRDLTITADALLAGWPVEDQVVFRDACLIAARRFEPGGEVTIRIEEEPALGRVKAARPAAPTRARSASRGSNSVGRVQPSQG